MSEFTITEFRQLRDALEQYERMVAKVEERMPGARDIIGVRPVIMAAARQTLDRYQKCEECKGIGSLYEGGNHDCEEDEMVCVVDHSPPCPSCGGRGIRPNQARLEQAAKAFNGTYRDNETGEQVQSDWAHDLDDLGAAVRAFDKETG